LHLPRMLPLMTIALLAAAPTGLSAQTAADPVNSRNLKSYLQSFEASPDLYKVIGEDKNFRVILATWKPGQSDAMHSHAGDLTNYTLTECQLKGVAPDGKGGELVRKKGTVGFNTASVHQVTNTGNNECVLLIIERK
ncbi:MAG: hypothetical protein AB7V13_19020, partial [Pseudorhodoplanes sp.]